MSYIRSFMRAAFVALYNGCFAAGHKASDRAAASGAHGRGAFIDNSTGAGTQARPSSGPVTVCVTPPDCEEEAGAMRVMAARLRNRV